MKKAFALLLVMVVSGCGLEVKTLGEFYEGDLENVSRVVVVDGNTGNQLTVEEEATIQSFLEEMREVEFIPEENQEARDGFNYSISLFEGEKKTFQFGATRVNDHYYETEPDVLPIIDEFYETNR